MTTPITEHLAAIRAVIAPLHHPETTVLDWDGGSCALTYELHDIRSIVLGDTAVLIIGPRHQGRFQHLLQYGRTLTIVLRDAQPWCYFIDTDLHWITNDF